MKTKIRRLFYPSRIVALAILAILVLLSIKSPLQAQTLTQGYGADEVLQRGMIVRLKADDATKVEALKFEEGDNMHGVVVDANDAPVTISSEGQKVFIATIGRFDVLVSDQSGPINSGDYITISSLNGIGMKAGDSEPVVIGRATASFDGKNGVISTAQVKRGDGNESVNIGRVQIDVGVTRNPLLKAAEPNLPGFLKKAAEAIAGKDVSPARAYVSVAVFLITAAIAGSLMYGGVKSGIISIGRNPLSKKSIVRGVLQVILTGLIIFISGIFGVYLLLRL